MSKINLKVSSSESSANIRSSLVFSGKNSKEVLASLASVLSPSDSLEIQLENADAAAASGTITFSGIGAADDTVIINGVTFTAVAAGATGNQWNVGGTAAASAANLAAAIAASTTALVSGYVSARASAAVVTVFAVKSGTMGNLATIAEGVDFSNHMAVSGARLTGGSEESASFRSIGTLSSI